MIALFGGTFNPIHYGHLLICEGIREEFDLEKVVFIPAKTPPHKDTSEIIQATHRLEMVKLATESNPYFEVSDIEMNRDGSSYTIDTLRTYKDLYNNQGIGLIVGADSLIHFESWRNYEEILSLAHVFVASRPDTDEKILDNCINKFTSQLGATIYKYSLRVMDYSSTEIRHRVSKGLSIKYLAPSSVEDYIYNAKLYLDNRWR